MKIENRMINRMSYALAGFALGTVRGEGTRSKSLASGRLSSISSSRSSSIGHISSTSITPSSSDVFNFCTRDHPSQDH